MRRFNFLEVLLVFLTVALVVLTFLTVIVIAYPKAGDRAVRNINDSLHSAFGFDVQKRVNKFLISISERAKVGWEQRIKKIPSKFTGIFKGFSGKPSVQKTYEQKKNDEARFLNCINCHKDIMQRKTMNHIYIDHRLHQSENVACSDCHKDIEHKKKPKPVKESACLDCHKKIKSPTATLCPTCHTPGSIFSDKVIAKNKTENFFKSRATKQLMPNGFEHGKTPQKCANCHDVPEFCNKCHLAFHKKLPNWKNIHGPNILDNKYSVASCKECHKATWCAAKCHPNPDRQPRQGKLIPPVIPLSSQ